MSEQNISEKVFEQIKEKKPKPRWHFLIKDYVIWFLGLISLLLGSLALAVVFYTLINNDWDIYREISNSFLKFIIITLPYFWFTFLALFILAAYYNFKNTKKGYKFPFYKVILLNIFFSLIFGFLFYSLGLAHKVEDSFNRDFPLYNEMFNQRKRIWGQVDRGLMAAFVVAVDDKQIVVEDVDGHNWQILKADNFRCPPLPIVEGDALRILGKKIDSQSFEADCILPLRGMRWMRPPLPDERKIMPMRIIR
ncbi:MAG: hypothetical protein PHO91_03135 [Patescibacteria group bacterium]|nr:hypothetical protein [Patescibacteria group bacterium]